VAFSSRVSLKSMDGLFYRIGLVDEVIVVSKAPKEAIIKRLKD
jgi:hypothetical protein